MTIKRQRGGEMKHIATVPDSQRSCGNAYEKKGQDKNPGRI